jgi:hypothetical protein
MSAVHLDWDAERLDVALTTKQVEHSPEIDTHQPVSRQHEAAPWILRVSLLLGWSLSVGSSVLPGRFGWFNQCLCGSHRGKGPERVAGFASAQHGSRNRFQIEAVDGEIGHVDGFVVDDEAWTIPYIEVATRNWLPGKKVLVSPAWIKRVRWTDSTVYTTLSREAIKDGPE